MIRSDNTRITVTISKGLNAEVREALVDTGYSMSELVEELLTGFMTNFKGEDLNAYEHSGRSESN